MKIISIFFVLLSIGIQLHSAGNGISSCIYSKSERRVTFECSGYVDERLFYPSFNHFCGDQVALNAFNKDEIKAIAFQNCELHELPREMFEEYNKVQVLNISNLGLKWLYLEEARSVIKIFASHNQLKMIPEQLGRIEQIDLSHNEIDEIKSKVNSSSCNRVTMLDLSFNNINEVNVDTFNLFCELQHLNLSYNRIKEIQPGTFSQLTKLKTLDLSNNYIQFSYNDIHLQNTVQLTVTIAKGNQQQRSKELNKSNHSRLRIDNIEKN
ncbi:phospholipase A2 inhibitor-like [Contarinia nasturtii]|uniref:phospholipase A2 inhibitor-like n=1 Tax=Contarinia nasturtii TaxID=265458 RepID=UPI0012D379DD|nr:phospholipase A2 inhibitor-like [Contarinia nasturtii]